jgi:hypothetical protein
MSSPTDYSGQQPAELYPQEGRGYSASSAPGAMQSPITSASSYRRESEAMDPSEFALFVEATSSLNINATSSSSSLWSRAPTRPSVTPNRLAAPLPPLPRSHSSPAPHTRFPSRQPSRAQLLADAITGWDGDESSQGSQEDELPDYAQSQAEAHARQRREAARRAQELDLMWSNSRRRRG